MSHNTHKRIRNLSHVSSISLALLFLYFIILFPLVTDFFYPYERWEGVGFSSIQRVQNP